MVFGFVGVLQIQKLNVCAYGVFIFFEVDVIQAACFADGTRAL